MYRFDAGHSSLGIEETIRLVEVALAFALRHVRRRHPFRGGSERARNRGRAWIDNRGVDHRQGRPAGNGSQQSNRPLRGIGATETEGTTMLNLFPLLLAKAGATAITTKVVVAGAVSVAALGGAGAAGVGPVADLLPSDASSVTTPDERSGEDALSDLATVPERDGSAAGDGFDRASELAAEEAQEALEAARKAAETAAADAQKAAEEAQVAAEQKAAEQARAEEQEAVEQARAEETQKETERRDAPSSSEHVVDQPEVEVQRAPGDTAGGPRG